MKDKQTKAVIIQWLIPVAALVLIAAVMLANFSMESSRTASDHVAELFLSTTEKYAEEVNYEIKGMAAAGKTIMQLINNERWISEERIIRMAEALYENSDAYAVLYHGGREYGLLHDGSKVQIADISYLADIEEHLAGIRESKAADEGVWTHYTYVLNDEIENEHGAVVSSLTIPGGKSTLLLYYPVEKLDRLFAKSEFGSSAFYAVVNPEGEIIRINNDTGGIFTEGGNIWDAVEDNEANQDLMQKITVRMRNKASGNFSANMGGTERRVVYAPVGINNWTLLVGVEQSYVDSLIEKELYNSEKMILRLLAAVGVFLGMLIVINIMGKLRSNERRKKLEEKADTDLLTGLNNKLATERKIKEYMEKHPKEQALLFVLDVDNFKKINDTLGHAFGDEVLSSLGHQVKAMFRASDIIGRTGGDEFMILLKNLGSDEILEKEAKKLGDFFKDFQTGEYVKYAATASIGAAVFPKDGQDFESMYKAADSALYVAKKRGKSQIAFYGDESEKSEGKKKVERESRVNK